MHEIEDSAKLMREYFKIQDSLFDIPYSNNNQKSQINNQQSPIHFKLVQNPNSSISGFNPNRGTQVIVFARGDNNKYFCFFDVFFR